MRLNRATLWALLVFALFMGIGAVIAGELVRERKQERRQTVSQIAANAAHSLKRQLSRSLSATSALAAILRQNGRIENFDALAAEIIKIYGGISALQLVPDGVITQVYPLAGNEKAVGFDILKDPARSFEALRAIESRRLSLDGPFELKQGGTAVVGRQAVFLPDGQGGERFWGFTAVIIRLPALMDASNLSLLEKNCYVFQVCRVHPNTGERIAFARGGGTLPKEPVEFTFDVPNGRWVLSVSPTAGWLTVSDKVLYGATVILVSLALGGLAYVIQRQPELLRSEVSRRTAELEGARGRLEEEVRERTRVEEEVRRLNADLEQRVAERTSQLAAVNQELELFTYSVSHDLRAPLDTIEGFTRTLREKHAGSLDENGMQVLMRICKAGDRMQELIGHLLELSRVSGGELVRQSVDLSAMAREIAADLQGGDPGRSVTFRIADGVVAPGGAGLLRVVLENLLGNAWKYTGGKEGALIEFGVEAKEGERLFFVRDNGAGFDMRYADRLFGVFQRLHSAAEFEGTGVGLATVRRIILRHGGRIWAEGSVGRGATFFFTLG
ncbi:CHASE domain-containing protein [Geobacter hydrogenophilus]|uniref:histidine kinase n=1 Tax=Geobacter hydrogenophilus TaxID=40983 RepID=A0A9W6LAG8_9BACT|nr:ATP-binding protein [Geobacter hydrogenophilus]MBT0894563.1 CHASE domain-containing protein [Geobacter hydrogenophilus]GLI37243.1 histidine kinase [Geobacter hydrogenophilus]